MARMEPGAALRDAQMWIKHWQIDVAHGLKPTTSSLARLLEAVEQALATGKESRS